MKEQLLRIYNELDQIHVSGMDVIHMANARIGLENIINNLQIQEEEEAKNDRETESDS